MSVVQVKLQAEEPGESFTSLLFILVVVVRCFLHKPKAWAFTPEKCLPLVAPRPGLLLASDSSHSLVN